MSQPPTIDLEPAKIACVRDYLLRLQDEICVALEHADGTATFSEDVLPGERGGLARPRALLDGPVIEKAAVNFSLTHGQQLPAAATERRPDLVGSTFTAVSVSLIVHPRNPYVPTTHANFRFFCAERAGTEVVWWFGGGFDLTPYYGFVEDAVHWHQTARAACAPLGPDAYPRYKKLCDEYFFLHHRGETRGIGGIFFDDLNTPDFATCWTFFQSAGNHFLPAYLPVVERRKNIPAGEREREFQLLRRGRYVEFNLLYDRGTRFGLQSGGRVESILASLPPLVRWGYAWHPPAGTPEERLYLDFLRPRDWLGEATTAPGSDEPTSLSCSGTGAALPRS